MAKNLIAYFTWSGNSAHLAQLVQGAAGGDLFHIRPQQPYPESYPMTASRAYKELQQHLWPALAEQVSEPEQYEQLYLIYPNWCGTMPMAMFTFLEHFDLTGKRILPFCTNEGSGMGHSEQDLNQVCTGATVEPGLSIRGCQAAGSRDQVADWVKHLL